MVNKAGAQFGSRLILRALLGLLLCYFLTISVFSIIAMPPRSAILPFTVMLLPQSSASSSLIGLCSPTTRYALPSLTIPTGPPPLLHLAPHDWPCFSPIALWSPYDLI